MNSLTRATLTLLPFATAVLSQITSNPYTDTDNGITFQSYTSAVDPITVGFVFPPVNSTGDTVTEFVAELIAPVSAGWVGVALGGAMTNNPLIVSWLNNGSIVRSTRNTTTHTLPKVYEGPIITDLPYTTINDTHWKWVFRCQGCTSWTGGNMTTDGTTVLAFAYSTTPVATPADPTSSFHKHTSHGGWELITSNAHSDNYSAIIAGTF